MNNEALHDLYNAIEGDYSVQRYTLGWKDVQEGIKRRYKLPIQRTKRELNEQTIKDALEFCGEKKKLQKSKNNDRSFCKRIKNELRNT